MYLAWFKSSKLSGLTFIGKIDFPGKGGLSSRYLGDISENQSVSQNRYSLKVFINTLFNQ